MIVRLHSNEEKNQAPISLQEARVLNISHNLPLLKVEKKGAERTMVFMDTEDFRKILTPKNYTKTKK